MLPDLLRRGWTSPLLMTWGASAARSLNLLVLLPLVVTTLAAEEIVLWYLFTTLIQLQLLADLGFSPTFVRVFAYAAGGAETHELASRTGSNRRGVGRTNWQTVERIWCTAQTVYARLTLVAVCGLAFVGTPLIWRPAMATDSPTRSLLAWCIILVGSTAVLRGNAYAAYLNGLDHVALVRRWEAVFHVLGVGSQIVVLILGGRLLALTIAHQAWMVLNVARNRLLARLVAEGRLKAFTHTQDRRVLDAVWPSAWRSGVGIAMGNLPLQATGLFYAQVAPPTGAAQYLVSLNVLNSIRGFAMAPFYSRIPAMARLRAEGALERLRVLAARGMRWSYWTLAALIIATGLVGNTLLASLGANTTLVPAHTWALFGLAFLLERYGAMHLHLYSTTNHVLWHTANGVTGALIVVVAGIAFASLDVTAFPVAMLAAYALFYVPFVVPRSLASVEATAGSFDAPALIGPGSALFGYTLYTFAAYLS